MNSIAKVKWQSLMARGRCYISKVFYSGGPQLSERKGITEVQNEANRKDKGKAGKMAILNGKVAIVT